MRRVHRTDRRGPSGAGRARDARRWPRTSPRSSSIHPTARSPRRPTSMSGDRRVELRHIGLGHTDHDIVIKVPDAARHVRRGPDRERRGAVRSGTPIRWTGRRRRRASPSSLSASSCPVMATTPGGRSWRNRPGRSRAWRSWPDGCTAGTYRWTTPLAKTPFPAYPAEDIRRPLQRALGPAPRRAVLAGRSAEAILGERFDSHPRHTV